MTSINISEGKLNFILPTLQLALELALGPRLAPLTFLVISTGEKEGIIIGCSIFGGSPGTPDSLALSTQHQKVLSGISLARANDFIDIPDLANSAIFDILNSAE